MLPEKKAIFKVHFLPDIFVAVTFAETNGDRLHRKVYLFSSAILKLKLVILQPITDY